jgi:hypothetical protein
MSPAGNAGQASRRSSDNESRLLWHGLESCDGRHRRTAVPSVGGRTCCGAVGPLGEGFLPDRVKQRAIHDRRLLTLPGPLNRDLSLVAAREHARDLCLALNANAFDDGQPLTGHRRLEPIFSRRKRLPSSRRKTMALNLRADCGQTRGQYPAPPP